MRWLIDNPEFKRLYWSRGPWPELVIIGITFLLTAFAAGGLGRYMGAGDPAQFLIYWMLFAVGGGGCLLIQNSIAREVRQKRWELQCMTGHDPLRFLLGRWLGSTFLLWALLTPLALIMCLIYGSSHRYEVSVAAFAMAVMICISMHMVCMFHSTWSASSVARSGLTVGVGGLFPALVYGVVMVIIFDPHNGYLNIIADGPNTGGSASYPSFYRGPNGVMHVPWLWIVGFLPSGNDTWLGMHVGFIPHRLVLLALIMVTLCLGAWRGLQQAFHYRLKPVFGPFLMALWLIMALFYSTTLPLLAHGLLAVVLVFLLMLHQPRPPLNAVKFHRAWGRTHGVIGKLQLLPPWSLALAMLTMASLGFAILSYMANGIAAALPGFFTMMLIINLQLWRDGLLVSVIDNQGSGKALKENNTSIILLFLIHMIELPFTILRDRVGIYGPPIGMLFWLVFLITVLALALRHSYASHVKSLMRADDEGAQQPSNKITSKAVSP